MVVSLNSEDALGSAYKNELCCHLELTVAMVDGESDLCPAQGEGKVLVSTSASLDPGTTSYFTVPSGWYCATVTDFYLNTDPASDTGSPIGSDYLVTCAGQDGPTLVATDGWSTAEVVLTCEGTWVAGESARRNPQPFFPAE